MSEKNKELNVKIKDGIHYVSINPMIYPLEVIYTASYVFLDRAYIVIDGDPEKEIIVKIRPKDKDGNEKIGLEFNNELINYLEYKTNLEQNKEIRQIILQRALMTNGSIAPGEPEEPTKESFMEQSFEDDDPEGIAIPWEEKYGKTVSGTDDTEISGDDIDDNKDNDSSSDSDGDYLDDPEGIAIPWEEKYG